MNAARITSILEQVGEDFAQVERVAWLSELEAIYERNGVLLNGTAPALHRGCPSRDTCWAGAEHRQHAEVKADVGCGERGSIFWPWVGRHYRRGGVCFISLNVNDAEPEWWSIAAEYGIAAHVFDRFNAGDRTPFPPSAFHWRMACTAHAVVASLDGQQPAREPSTVQAAMNVLERISRIQAVKCSPLRAPPRGTQRHRAAGRAVSIRIECHALGRHRAGQDRREASAGS